MLTFLHNAAIWHISLEEYLGKSYRPDCEYVDGEIRERNVGKWEQARVPWLLALWFGTHQKEWGTMGSTEQRVRVSANRVRVPDLVVLAAGAQPDVLTDPPRLVIENLFPDHSYSDTQQRTKHYREMGVETVWIVDPKRRAGCMCRGSEWVEASRLEAKGTPRYVSLSDIFGQLTSA